MATIFKMDCPINDHYWEGFCGLKMPLKTDDLEGHFVPNPIPKSKFQFSYVIGTKEGFYEKLHFRICQSIHRSTKSG